MDTQKAIDILTALKLNVDSQIGGLTDQSEAIGIALSQLQGILVTQTDAIQAVYDAKLKDIQSQSSIDNVVSP